VDSDKRLDSIGLGKTAGASWNLGVGALYEHAVRNRDGVVTASGALLCETGQHTGRSPKDKFIGRAPPCQGGCRGFESLRPLQLKQISRDFSMAGDYI
jgi:ATP-dependent phosphoenolpyruvate carboxykinase